MKKLLELIENSPHMPDFIKDNKELVLRIIAVALVILIAFAVYTKKESEANEISVQEETAATTEVKGTIFVDVGGEVKVPSVVELEEGSRVTDAISAAGGLTDNADISEINRAAFVSDGEKIFVPPLVEDEGEYGQSSGGYSDGKININTADLGELQELTGVGPAIAEKIVSYREENGRFKSKEDIKNVSGIGDKIYEKFKDDIRV